jgi:WD40 repeat protein
LLAIADYDLAATIRDSATGAEIASLPGDPERRKYRQARRVAFLPDHKRLAVGYSTGEVFLWDVAAKKVSLQFNHGQEITALAVSPDGRRIATGTDFGLRVWDVASGKPAVSLDQQSSGKHQVREIAFTPDGKTVIAADSPGFVKFFASEDGKELRSFKMPSVGGETTVYGLCVTGDGKTAVVPGLIAGQDPKRPNTLTDGLLLLDIATARPRAFLPAVPARVFALSPDGKTAALATGDSGDPVFLYNLATASPLK